MLVQNVFAISAQSYIVTEQSSGNILCEKNAHTKLPMASTTKIMTALCAIENGDMDSLVKVSDKAVGVEGSSIYLESGESLTLKDLLYGLMLHSGNDAAVAVAIHISSDTDSFVKLMNETALKIGAKNTHFTNPNGLPHKEHYTTAYDLNLITRYAMKYDEFREIVSTYQKAIPWAGREYQRQLKNHNKLLRMYEGTIGVKTGYTKAAGRCLVSSAMRNGIEVVCVTLNAPDDWNDHIYLMDDAFGRLSIRKIFSSGDYMATVAVKDSDEERVGVVAKDDISMVISDGKIPEINVETKIPSFLQAPVGFEQVVGEVNVYEGERLIGRTDLVTERAVRKKQKPSVLKNIYTALKEFVLN